MHVAGAANGDMTLADCLTDGVAAGAMAAVDCGFAAMPRSRRRTPRTSQSPSRRCGTSRTAAQGLRRFPERRHRQRYRARRSRGLSLGRASQALHHARHGDRPGQDRRTSPALRSSPSSPAGRSRRSAPRPIGRLTCRCASARWPAIIAARTSARRGCTPSHQWATEQGAVFVETGAWLRAQYYPRAGREGLARDRQPRGDGDARQRRRLRRLDPRQDRDRRARTPALSSTASTPTRSRRLPVGKARYGLMLREDGFVMDDGTTSRLADRPLSS